MIAMEASALALFWAAVIAVAIAVYVILDGFDLGVGILFGTTRDQALRNEMMDAISPFWDGTRPGSSSSPHRCLALSQPPTPFSCRRFTSRCCCSCSG
jgi:hypothetical protein